jgi:DinB family protein
MQTAFNLSETIALLSRTPSTLNTLLRGLPTRWVAANEGADSWSALDIVGHLVSGERTDWMPRAKRILEHVEAVPLDPFDRFAQEKECRGKSLEELLDGFAALRAQNLAALETLHLCAADLAKKGTHQRLGTVTLAQLLATWVAHDLTHLHQLSRVMAYQYRDAVGPWTAYLGVMHCTGHSAP